MCPWRSSLRPASYYSTPNGSCGRSPGRSVPTQYDNQWNAGPTSRAPAPRSGARPPVHHHFVPEFGTGGTITGAALPEVEEPGHQDHRCDPAGRCTPVGPAAIIGRGWGRTSGHPPTTRPGRPGGAVTDEDSFLNARKVTARRVCSSAVPVAPPSAAALVVGEELGRMTWSSCSGPTRAGATSAGSSTTVDGPLRLPPLRRGGLRGRRCRSTGDAIPPLV